MANVSSGQILDTNHNGVSDVWESFHGIQDPSDTHDSDGDGQSDRVEALQGTDPWDPNSRFQLEVINYSPSATYLTWSSKEGKRYQVQSLNSLGKWIVAGDGIPGNGSMAGFRMPTDSYGLGIFRLALLDDITLRPEFQTELAAKDSDGDGQSDWIEWRAGTSLIDPSEKFQLNTPLTVSVVTLQWPTVRGMKYRLQKWTPAAWLDLEGTYSGDGEICTATLTAVESTALFRLVSEMPDSDADGLADWEEHLASLDPFHPNSVDVLRNDAEVVAQEIDQGGTFVMEAVSPTLIVGRDQEGSVRLRREGGLAAVMVPLNVGGTAVPGIDYEAIPASVTLGFGVKELEIPIRRMAGISPTSSKEVVISLGDSPHYQFGETTTRSIVLLVENLVDVTSFGAIGDGLVDDGPAIQAAIDFLEADATYNGLHFPSGTYRLATPVTDYAIAGAIGNRRILKLGRTTDLAGRDIVLRGDLGAVLYSTASPERVNMLICMASFRSLTMCSLRFEQSPVPLTAISLEPNRSDGVTVIHVDARNVEGIRFQNTHFVNCHRSVSIHGTGYDLRGKCGVVRFDHCELLNPYGSNTANGRGAWGGGQQTYIPPWVAEARYENCLFDGGADEMSDSTTTPGGVCKDGGHFGCPLRLIFRNNVVRRMGIEALFQTKENTLMGYTQSGFTMPPGDDASEVSVVMSNTPSTWVNGETVIVRTPLTPGVAVSASIMNIRSFDPATRTVSLTNQGKNGTVPTGTFIPSGRTVNLDERPEPTYAIVEDNLFDGTIPSGGYASPEHSAIVTIARAKVARNIIKNFGKGVLFYPEGATSFPASQGSVIEDNVILTRNAKTYPVVATYGISVSGSDERIRRNLVWCPVSFKTIGLYATASNTRLEANTFVVSNLQDNGYANPDRSIGIASGNTASGLFALKNSTRGFDVGVGSQAFQAIPYRAKDHRSILDVLPLDPLGLIPSE